MVLRSESILLRLVEKRIEEDEPTSLGPKLLNILESLKAGFC